MTLSKFCVQTQEAGDSVIDYARLVRPVATKVINVWKADFFRRLKAAHPGGLVVYRHYPDPEGWLEDPVGAAERHVDELAAELSGVLQYIDFVEDANEWLKSADSDRFEAADIFMSTFVELLWAKLGKRAVCLNASCGHFSDDVVAFWRTIAALLKRGGKLGLHEYDWPTMDRLHLEDIAQGGEGFWLCGKWKRVTKALRDAGMGVPGIFITEAGVDRGVVPGSDNRGFRFIHEGDLAACVESYCGSHSLAWYNSILDDDVEALFIFGMSMGGDWKEKGFDIEGTKVPYRIKEFGGEPPPQNGDDDMAVKVIDRDQIERDEQWARDEYGLKYRRAQAEPGQLVWRLVEWREKTGHSSLITQTLGQDGLAKENVDVAFYWPGAPEPPDPPTTVYDHDWYRNFVHGPTNVNGDVGPGMGNDAYKGRGECGPHSVWVRDSNILSDISECHGMLAGTFHDHVDQVFQLQVEGGNGNGGDTVLVRVERLVLAAESSMLGIAYPRAVVQDTRGEVQAPGIDDLVDPKDWTHPASGQEYALVEFCADFGGGEPREYKIRVVRLPNYDELTPWETETFEPLGTARERVVYVYQEGGNGNGEEPPPVSGIIAWLRETSTKCSEAADALEFADAVAEQMAEDAAELADLL